jgi:hypothetical protein
MGIGGLIGNCSANDVENCYSIGRVNGGVGVGGLIGDMYGWDFNGSAVNCFWDIDTSDVIAKNGQGINQRMFNTITLTYYNHKGERK